MAAGTKLSSFGRSVASSATTTPFGGAGASGSRTATASSGVFESCGTYTYVHTVTLEVTSTVGINNIILGSPDFDSGLNWRLVTGTGFTSEGISGGLFGVTDFSLVLVFISGYNPGTTLVYYAQSSMPWEPITISAQDGGAAVTANDSVLGPDPVVVPEPGSMVLLGSDLVALGTLRRRMGKRKE